MNPIMLVLATLRVLLAQRRPVPTTSMHSVLIERYAGGFRIQSLRPVTTPLFIVRSPNMPSLRRPKGAPIGVTINERYLMKPALGVNPRLN